jgi:histidinol-phosphate phosphatase family protein
MNKAVFLDRDGTIIEEKNYLSDPAQVNILPGVGRGLQLLSNHGFKLILTTNQSGIARKYFTLSQLKSVHKKMVMLLAKSGVKLDAIYYCPHAPDDRCSCRKPLIGMILKAKTRFNLDLTKSYSIGDKLTDVQLAHNFNGKGILVLTGYGKKERGLITKQTKPEFISKTLYETAKWIITDSSARD